MAYRVYLCGVDGRLVEDACPGGHTPSPAGYLEWFDWAAEMAKTHKQKPCPQCGRLAIWLPKVVS